MRILKIVKSVILIILMFGLLVGCSDETETVLEANEEIEINLYAIDELNATVWDDSKEVFDCLVKILKFDSITEQERKEYNEYFEKYYDSGYWKMEGAEHSLVLNLHSFKWSIIMRSAGTKDEQKEKARSIEEQYMEIDQRFKEHSKN